MGKAGVGEEEKEEEEVGRGESGASRKYILTNIDQTADVIICTTFRTCYLSICRSHVFVASTFEEMHKFRST